MSLNMSNNIFICVSIGITGKIESIRLAQLFGLYKMEKRPQILLCGGFSAEVHTIKICQEPYTEFISYSIKMEE